VARAPDLVDKKAEPAEAAAHADQQHERAPGTGLHDCPRSVDPERRDKGEADLHHEGADGSHEDLSAEGGDDRRRDRGILAIETGRFKQKSERLKGIALLRVCKATEDFLIDQLLIAGGDGKPIGNAMRNDIRSALKRYEEGRGNRPDLRGQANWLPR